MPALQHYLRYLFQLVLMSVKLQRLVLVLGNDLPFSSLIGAHTLNLLLAKRIYLHQREDRGLENQQLSHIVVGQSWQDAVAQPSCSLCPNEVSALSRPQAAASRGSDYVRFAIPATKESSSTLTFKHNLFSYLISINGHCSIHVQFLGVSRHP